MKTFYLLPIILLFLSSSAQKQANWDQYLGPNRDAKITGPEIAQSWGEDGPAKLWEFPLGSGYGGASIYGDEVFILDRKDGNTDILRCVDLQTGKEKWNYSYEAPDELPYPGSRAVPTVDENHIWCVGPHGHFHCIDKNSHEVIWKRNIVKENDAETANWGISQSPVIYKNLAIVAPHGSKAGVVAYDKLSGEIKWSTRPLKGHNYYVSPILANYGGIDQVIVISPYNRRDSTKTQEVVAFEANSGEELWSYTGLKSFATITPATVIDETKLFLTDCSYNGSYKPVSILLEITKSEDEFVIKELFKTEEAGCKMHPAIVVDNHFYINSNKRPGRFMCLDMQGNVVWGNEDSPDFEMGGLIMVNGLIINQNGVNGDIHLIEPTPEGYKELGKASFFDSEKSQAWAPMASSQGKLIVRDMEKMICVDLQK